MNLKEWVRFTYGMLLGTSVQYLKPTKRFLWPTAFRQLTPNVEIMLGGSAICGIIGAGDERFLINCNSGAGAETLAQQLKARNLKVKSLVGTNVASDFLGGIVLFSDAENILVPRVSSHVLLKLFSERPPGLMALEQPKIIQVGEESVELIPSGNCATENDLLVWLPQSGVLFLGALFYNQVHPIIRAHDYSLEKWIGALEGILEKYSSAKYFVPAEGNIGSRDDLKLFVRYLRDLSDPNIEFADCRKNYDWVEIPSYTSLEENFDLIRLGQKSHTTLT